MLSQLTINAVLKDYVRFSAGFMSKVGASTSSTPAYSAEKQFLSQHVSVKFAATVATLGTASDVNLRAINLTVNKNVEDWQNLGSIAPADIVNKAFSVNGDMELLFDDETYRDYVTDGDKMACMITIENTDDLIGTASYPKLEITLAPMSFRDWGKNTGQDDITTQTVVLLMVIFGITASKTVSIDFSECTERIRLIVKEDFKTWIDQQPRSLYPFLKWWWKFIPITCEGKESN